MYATKKYPTQKGRTIILSKNHRKNATEDIIFARIFFYFSPWKQESPAIDSALPSISVHGHRQMRLKLDLAAIELKKDIIPYAAESIVHAKTK